MSRPGVPGIGRRRVVAASVVLLGVLDVALAALRHPVIRIGPIHNVFHYTVVHGSRYILLVAALALIASGQGLLHGKRHAWHFAVAAAAATFVAHSFKMVDLVGVGATIGVSALLLGSRSYFPARSDPVRGRQGLVWLLFGELAVFLYGAAGLYLLDRDFREPTGLGDAIDDSFRLLFLQPAAAIEPVTRHGRWFVDSVRVMAVLVLGVAFWHFLHPVIRRLGVGRTERANVVHLLEEWATTSLAHFQLLEDKDYFFADDGRAFIGYRVAGGTAVALGGPIGEPASCREVAQAFAEFCDLNGWAFCFHQVTEEEAGLLRGIGLNALKLGEEAVIPVQEFSLTGKPFKHLRNSTHRLERLGYTVGTISQPMSEDDLDQIEEVSDLWLADGNHRERQFTLGAFSRNYMQQTEVIAVRAVDGRIEAFANLIPTYQSTSGNFDLMRRRPDAPEGAMDFLFVHLVTEFQKRGFTGMTLGFAPLANIEGAGLVPRALRLLYERGGRAFNFQGLRAFKEKWRPAWEPRYVVYRSDLQLPQIALAIARAGEREGHSPWSLFRSKKSGTPRKRAA